MTRLKRILEAMGACLLACLSPRLSRRVECDALLARALSTVKPEMDAVGGSMHGGSLPAVRADPRQLEKVFRVLLRNGLRHRGEEPAVLHVSARPAGREWLFTVRDNGKGVDASRHQVIFSPFSGARELPACAQIVRRHGGRIWVESVEGRGATFCFTIPATKRMDFVA